MTGRPKQAIFEPGQVLNFRFVTIRESARQPVNDHKGQGNAGVQNSLRKLWSRAFS
jgi:hypothetical protein